jgi:hypothetical protein
VVLRLPVGVALVQLRGHGLDRAVDGDGLARGNLDLPFEVGEVVGVEDRGGWGGEGLG